MNYENENYPREESIHPATTDDQPTKIDVLGFEPYVRAIADFLTNQNTKPPLTLSIEGEWGSGKSSFMLQLEEELKRRNELTITFNAWRHDKEEALWAAFALNFIKQISHKSLFSFLGYIKLFYLRLKNDLLDSLRFSFILLFIVSILLAIPLLLYINGFDWPYSLLDKLIKLDENMFLYGNIKKIINIGGITALIGIFLSIVIELRKLLRFPLEINLNKYIKSPHYENQIAFIEQFHEDFKKIVAAYAGKKNVYIFIDDLDRCELPKATDLMQALNLMISNDSNLIFILGMDRKKIAAGFAVKHENLHPYLFSSKPESEVTKVHNDLVEGLEYGFAFIEKFIQLPFLVPQPGKSDLHRFLKKISNPPIQTTGKFNQAKIFVGKYLLQEPREKKITNTLSKEHKTRREMIKIAVTGDSQNIHKVVLMVAPALDNNPRRLKQFINLFRLKTFIANETGLFDYSEDSTIEECLTLEQLGKFVAISLKWPLLLSDLDTNRELLKELQDFALGIELDEEKLSDSANYWKNQQKLIDLLRYGCFNEENVKNMEKNFSLSKLDVAKLLQVSPQVVRQKENNTLLTKQKDISKMDNVAEIKKMAENISKITEVSLFEGFVEELNAISRDFKVGDPIGLERAIDNLQLILSDVCSKIPEEEKDDMLCELIGRVKDEKYIEDKIDLINMVLSKLPNEILKINDTEIIYNTEDIQTDFDKLKNLIEKYYNKEDKHELLQTIDEIKHSSKDPYNKNIIKDKLELILTKTKEFSNISSLAVEILKNII